MKQIEIEHRALLTEGQYDHLLTFLNQNAEDLGADDKIIHFFLFPDKLLKVVDNLSHNSAKIVVKLNRIGRGSDFEELEIPISRDDVANAAHIFETFDVQYILEPIVKRHNYVYKGVELAVKYSKSWGYHMELEILISDLAGKERAEQQIEEVAAELGVTIMTQAELAAFTKNIEDNYIAPTT